MAAEDDSASQPAAAAETPGGRRRASAIRRASGRSSALSSGRGAASASAVAACRPGGDGSSRDDSSLDRSPAAGTGSGSDINSCRGGRGTTRLARQRERRPPSRRAAKARRTTGAAGASAAAIACGGDSNSSRNDGGGCNGSARGSSNGAAAAAAGAEAPGFVQPNKANSPQPVGRVAEVKNSTTATMPSGLRPSSSSGSDGSSASPTRCLAGNDREAKRANGIDHRQQQKRGDDDHCVAAERASATIGDARHHSPQPRRSVGVLTDADCLGPCEPGTHVSLDGIVWQETANGVLVVNVTWRGKTYMGTLLDATKHDWAPPRLQCESPSGDVESRSSKSRIRRKPLLLTAAFREDVSERKLLRKQHRGGGGGSRGSSSRVRRSQSRSSIVACGAASDNRPTPTPCKRRTKSPAVVTVSELVAVDPAANAAAGDCADGEQTGVELNGPVAKRRRSSLQSGEEQTVSDAVASLGSAFLHCPEPGCSRKYRQASSLRHHLRQVHRRLARKSDGGETVQGGAFAPDEHHQLVAAVVRGAESADRFDPTAATGEAEVSAARRTAAAACMRPVPMETIATVAVTTVTTTAAAGASEQVAGSGIVVVGDNSADHIVAPVLTSHSASAKADLHCDRTLASIASPKAADERGAHGPALAGLNDASPVPADVAITASHLLSLSPQPARALPPLTDVPGGGAWRPGCQPVPAFAASAAGGTAAVASAKGRADRHCRVSDATASPGAVGFVPTGRMELQSSPEAWPDAACDDPRRPSPRAASTHSENAARSASDFATGIIDGRRSPAALVAPILPRAAAAACRAVRPAAAIPADACSDVSDDGPPSAEPSERPSGPARSPIAAAVPVTTKVRSDYEDWRSRRRLQQQQQQHWMPPGSCSQFAYPVVAVSPRKADKGGEIASSGNGSNCIVPATTADRSCSPRRAVAADADARQPASASGPQSQPPKKSVCQPKREIPMEAAAVLRRNGAGVGRIGSASMDGEQLASLESYYRQQQQLQQQHHQQLQQQHHQQLQQQQLHQQQQLQHQQHQQQLQQQQLLMHAHPFGMRYYHPWHGLPPTAFDDAAAAAAASSFMHLMDWLPKPADRPHSLPTAQPQPPQLSVPFAAGSPQDGYGCLPFLLHGRKSVPAEGGLLPPDVQHASRYEVLKESIELKSEMSRLPHSPHACAPSPKREKQQQLAPTASAAAAAGSSRRAVVSLSPPCDSKLSSLAQAVSPLAADACRRLQHGGGGAATATLSTPSRGRMSPASSLSRVGCGSSPPRPRPSSNGGGGSSTAARGSSCTAAPPPADGSAVGGVARHTPHAVHDARLQQQPSPRADCSVPMLTPHSLMLFDEAALRSAAVAMQCRRSAASSVADTVIVDSPDEKKAATAAIAAISPSACLSVPPSEHCHRRATSSSLSSAAGKGAVASPLATSASLRRHHKAPELGDVAL